MSLKPVVRETSAQQVASQLLDLMRQRVWRPGDRLPSERDLVDRLGVGRSTVREATQILSTLNVVQVLPGTGTFVRALESGHIFRPDLIGLLVNDASILEVLEARKILEPQSVALACLRAGDAELQAIEEVLQRHDEALRAGRPVAEEARLFHVMLAEASHNAVCAAFIRSILDLLQERRRKTMPAAALQAELDDHRAILSLVKKRDAAAACALLIDHVVRSAVIDADIAEAPLAKQVATAAPTVLAGR